MGSFEADRPLHLNTCGKIPRLQKALRIASLGYRVFPLHTPNEAGGCSCKAGASCKNPGKHPRIIRYQHEATTDLEKIRGWWAKWPDANVGIACGRTADPDWDFIAFDSDSIEGLGHYLAWQGLEWLPDNTTVVASGSPKPGKNHIYHRVPSGSWIISRQGDLPDGTLVEGLDIRGHNAGLVVAPGGLHASGGAYRAIEPMRRPSELSDLSPKLSEALLGQAPHPQPQATAKATANTTAAKTSQARRPRAATTPSFGPWNNQKEVQKLAALMTERFPITGHGTRHKAQIAMIGSLLGRGRHPDLVNAAGQEWLRIFHGQGFIGRPLEECFDLLAEDIAYTVAKRDTGEFWTRTQAQHIDDALAPGLSWYLEAFVNSYVPEKGSGGGGKPFSASVATPTQTSPRIPSYRPGDSLIPLCRTEQEKAFARALMIWARYQLATGPDENLVRGEISMTEEQLLAVMADLGCTPTRKQLSIVRARFTTSKTETYGQRTIKGRRADRYPLLYLVRRGGYAVPSRFRLGRALLERLLSEPDWDDPPPDESELSEDEPVEAAFLPSEGLPTTDPARDSPELSEVDDWQAEALPGQAERETAARTLPKDRPAGQNHGSPKGRSEPEQERMP